MASLDRVIWADALHQTAEAWTDPDYGPRVDRITRACETEAYPFTEEHITFAVNQQMDACLRASLQSVAAAPKLDVTAAHLHLQGQRPLYGLPLIVYLTLRGVTVHVSTTHVQPLLQDLLQAVRTQANSEQNSEQNPVPEAAPVQWEDTVPAGMPILTLGSGNSSANDDDAAWTYVERPAVVVLDGNESADEREALAEDILVYDGRAPQHVGLIWAPEGLAPDAYLESLAHMRGAIPAHESIPGTLQMQQAFLEAQDAPHAYADDLTFLFSRGAPEIQSGLHVRWAEYTGRDEAGTWVAGNANAVGPVLCRQGGHDRVQRVMPEDKRVARLGTLHRADWWPPCVQALQAFAHEKSLHSTGSPSLNP